MPHIKLHDKDDKLVHEVSEHRLETSGSLSLPRVITHEGKVYRWTESQQGVHKYVEQK